MAKTCNKCGETKCLSGFSKNKRSTDGLNTRCKLCISIKSRIWYLNNSKKVNLYTKDWREKNPEKYKATSKARYDANPDKVKNAKKIWCEANQERLKTTNNAWRAINSEKEKISAKHWRENNRGKINANGAKYDARKLQATPKWLTKEDWQEIEDFYVLAQDLAWLNQDGIPFHVDHIVPLQGKNVSGLHVPWNLQLLPAKENVSKGNKHISEHTRFYKPNPYLVFQLVCFLLPICKLNVCFDLPFYHYL